MEPAERYRRDPHFHYLVDVLYREFERCDHGGAGLTPTEVREASALAWQRYAERHVPVFSLSPVAPHEAQQT